MLDAPRPKALRLTQSPVQNAQSLVVPANMPLFQPSARPQTKTPVAGMQPMIGAQEDFLPVLIVHGASLCACAGTESSNAVRKTLEIADLFI
jgi:hypothetical protein